MGRHLTGEMKISVPDLLARELFLGKLASVCYLAVRFALISSVGRITEAFHSANQSFSNGRPS